MPSKQVTISARISQDDAEFIRQLTIDDAKTPSDKLRSNRKQDYASNLQHIQELVQPVLRRIRKAEVENRVHSELIIRLTEWIPDALAFLLSSISDHHDQQITEALFQFEQGVAERLIRLMESVLQLTITEHCDCYNPEIIRTKIGPVLELSRIIMAKK